jgi:hypothetical protein
MLPLLLQTHMSGWPHCAPRLTAACCWLPAPAAWSRCAGCTPCRCVAVGPPSGQPAAQAADGQAANPLAGLPASHAACAGMHCPSPLPGLPACNVHCALLCLRRWCCVMTRGGAPSLPWPSPPKAASWQVSVVGGIGRQRSTGVRAVSWLWRPGLAPTSHTHPPVPYAAMLQAPLRAAWCCLLQTRAAASPDGSTWRPSKPAIQPRLVLSTVSSYCPPCYTAS